MKIGIMSGVSGAVTVESLVADAQAAADDGFSTYWFAQIVQQHEAMNLIGVISQSVQGINFGTAVVPTYPRHPMVMAEQAMTTSMLTGGRFTLGVGLSHQVVVEAMWGLSYAKPLRHMREYLDILVPLLDGEQVSVAGEEITGRGKLDIAGASRPDLLIAALGPQMLRLAGRKSEGTITWMTGAKTLAGHIVPTISEAAEEAGRPAPSIVCGLPVWVTDDVAAARESTASTFEIYGQLPSYRAMLDREGLGGPEDLAVIGDEATCTARLDELAAAGATELNAVVSANNEEDRQRTRALLAGRVG